jgi:hypothetical protein
VSVVTTSFAVCRPSRATLIDRPCHSVLRQIEGARIWASPITGASRSNPTGVTCLAAWSAVVDDLHDPNVRAVGCAWTFAWEPPGPGRPGRWRFQWVPVSQLEDDAVEDRPQEDGRGLAA